MPAAAEAVACALEQELQVGAGVAVERGEDLVGLHVGLGLRERDRRALGELLARVPGSISIVMSWSPVRGRSSTVASERISGAYFSSTSIVTTALPSLELDLGDVADLDPGDVHGLALARGDRLRGRELGLELEPVVAEDRDPGRVGLLLLGEDVGGHRQPRHQQGRDRDEVAQVFADRASHGTVAGAAGPTSPGRPVPPVPLTSGSGLVWQATSVRYGGTVDGEGRAGAE